MYASLITLAASVLLFAQASPLALEKRVTCTDQAVVFAIRGSDPSQTTVAYNPRYSILPQGMTDTANAVISKAGGNSYLQAISYPAVKPDPPGFSQYQQSVSQGVDALRQAVTDYANACPRGKIFIVGYSQGAQVTTNTLGGAQALAACGRGESSDAGSAAETNSTTDDSCTVAGVALFADPAFLDFQVPIDQGNAKDNGRNGTASGNGTLYQNLKTRYSSRLRSYCQLNDIYCDRGNSSAVHMNATTYFQSDATAFLTSKV